MNVLDTIAIPLGSLELTNMLVKNLILRLETTSVTSSIFRRKMNTSVSVISRYERNEMMPSIDTAKKLADFLNTTVGFLLGETEDDDLLKDHKMISRLKDVNNFSDDEKQQIYFTLDALIREIKNRRTYAVEL